uniref:Uncharacterized protein n=1 Tax=Globodera rostochiensis TaxID=31243 RepID=A0A914H026_GLORO
MEGMEALKVEFFKSADPVNFIMYFWTTFAIILFDEKNNLTGERLVLRQIKTFEWLLVRCPIERDEAKWAELEKEAAEWNCIGINFKDNEIGDGMSDGNEAPENE